MLCSLERERIICIKIVCVWHAVHGESTCTNIQTHALLTYTQIQTECITKNDRNLILTKTLSRRAAQHSLSISMTIAGQPRQTRTTA